MLQHRRTSDRIACSTAMWESAKLRDLIPFESAVPILFDSIRKSWDDSKILESAVPAHCSSKSNDSNH